MPRNKQSSSKILLLDHLKLGMVVCVCGGGGGGEDSKFSSR